MRSSTISGREKARLHKSSDSRVWSYQARFLDIESRLGANNVTLVAGVDEVGRGPLAGPVVASAVILRFDDIPPGIKDSKKLSPNQRVSLFEKIRRAAVSIGIGVVSARGIDRVNILEATMLAMSEAVRSLSVEPGCVVVDGNRLPRLEIPVIGMIRGDSRCISVAAASIVAKVTRDRFMDRMDVVYPRYRFCRNKGYGTKAHLAALSRYGPTRVHRYSFEPVSGIMEGRR